MEDIILDPDLLLKNIQFKDVTKSDTSLIGSDVIVIKKKYFLDKKYISCKKAKEGAI
jgi:hypothetical protein